MSNNNIIGQIKISDTFEMKLSPHCCWNDAANNPPPQEMCWDSNSQQHFNSSIMDLCRNNHPVQT